MEVAGQAVHPPPAPPAPRQGSAAGRPLPGPPRRAGRGRGRRRLGVRHGSASIPSTARNCGGRPGQLRRALPLLGPAFFVLYGDSYLECDYAAVQEAFEAAGKLALMTVFRNEGQWDTSNVEFRDGRILAYDKVARTPAMQYIDYGLGVLRPAGLRRRSRNGPVRSGRGLSGDAPAGRARRLRGHGAVLRDRLGGGARGDAGTPGRREQLNGRHGAGGDQCHTQRSSCPRPSR